MLKTIPRVFQENMFIRISTRAGIRPTSGANGKTLGNTQEALSRTCMSISEIAEKLKKEEAKKDSIFPSLD